MYQFIITFNGMVKGGMRIINLFFLFLLVSPASAKLDIVRPDKDLWVCVDYSTNYMRENPEWKCVSMSNNIYFKGISHVVNYQLEGENLNIHDEMYGIDYTIEDYKNSGICFHFWENEPIRNYKFLRVNNP